MCHFREVSQRLKKQATKFGEVELATKSKLLLWNKNRFLCGYVVCVRD